jgi:hypothetical protein
MSYTLPTFELSKAQEEAIIANFRYPSYKLTREKGVYMYYVEEEMVKSVDNQPYRHVELVKKHWEKVWRVIIGNLISEYDITDMAIGFEKEEKNK